MTSAPAATPAAAVPRPEVWLVVRKRVECNPGVMQGQVACEAIGTAFRTQAEAEKFAQHVPAALATGDGWFAARIQDTPLANREADYAGVFARQDEIRRMSQQPGVREQMMARLQKLQADDRLESERNMTKFHRMLESKEYRESVIQGTDDDNTHLPVFHPSG